MDAPRNGSSATQRSGSSATIDIMQRQQQRGGRAGGVVRENEKRGESEPSGSSELCESAAVVGSVGGLIMRGTEKSVQLSGETIA